MYVCTYVDLWAHVLLARARVALVAGTWTRGRAGGVGGCFGGGPGDVQGRVVRSNGSRSECDRGGREL